MLSCIQPQLNDIVMLRLSRRILPCRKLLRAFICLKEVPGGVDQSTSLMAPLGQSRKGNQPRIIGQADPSPAHHSDLRPIRLVSSDIFVRMNLEP